ncbi:aggrecan core protein-like isoform X10 [Narcine bancroftii]|uniref:aggrecan core protein-like isoform X10 n=1 Tax=Narcine bancroftii TaxID=1343680 RepID=UPI0038320463
MRPPALPWNDLNLDCGSSPPDGREEGGFTQCGAGRRRAWEGWSSRWTHMLVLFTPRMQKVGTRLKVDVGYPQASCRLVSSSIWVPQGIGGMYTAAILLLFLTHEFPEPSSAEESASSSSWTAAELETAGDDYMPQSLDAALTSLSSSGDLLQDSNQQTFASLDLDLLLLVDEETQISMLTARNPTGDFPPPRLPTESIPETNSKDYIFVKSEKTWNDAQNYCRAEHTDLASIASLEENAQVAKVLQSDSPAWIGLFNRHQSERSWAWSNGNEFSFSYWDQFYPMDFTAMSVCVIVVSGQWKDTPCDFKFPFVCYAGKGVRYPIPPLHPSAGPELGRWIQGWVSPSEGEEPLGQILGQHGGSHVSTTSWVRPNLFNIRATHDELQAFESYKIQPNITHILIQKYVYIIIFIHV